jgi:carbonic anhydrase
MIEPGLKDLDPSLQGEARVRAVEANVRWSLQQLNDLPEVKAAAAAGRAFRMAGAVYELETGAVRLLT